jgi:hypothetical protein
MKGSVIVNGQVMTQEKYKQAVITTLEENNNKWMTCDEMVEWASHHNLCERKNAYRKAMSHPLWKIISNMMEEKNPVITRMSNINNVFIYKLKVSNVYIDKNGRRWVRRQK